MQENVQNDRKYSIEHLEELIHNLKLATNETEEGIEKMAGYNYGYFSQIRSRAKRNPASKVSQKLIKNLENTYWVILQNAKPGVSRSMDSLNEVNSPSSDFLAGKLSTKEELIAEKEARRRDAEKRAEKLEMDKETLNNIIKEQFSLIRDYLKPIHEKSTAVLDYQHAWVEIYAEVLSNGDEEKKAELIVKMGNIIAGKPVSDLKTGKK